MKARPTKWASLFALVVPAVMVTSVMTTTDAEGKGKKPKPGASASASASAAAPGRRPAAPAPAGEKWTQSPGGPTCNSGFVNPKDGSQRRACATSDNCCVKSANGGLYTSCTDIKNDAFNCGGCGRHCPTGESCTDGMCGCGDQQLRCDGKCVDAFTDVSDAFNCGRCGKKCSQLCLKGKCAPCAAFGDGKNTYCKSEDSGYCANLKEDDSDCGKCGHECTDGRTCTSGRCTF